MDKVFQNDFEPTQAIIVFKQNRNFENNYYLESRRIEHTDKGYQMTEGTPLSKNTLAQIMDSVKVDESDKITCSSIFPKNLLYYQIKNLEPHIVWFVPSGAKSLIFSKSLNIKNGEAHLPTLVFSLKGKELSVFAVKTNNPNGDTLLYKAPFHNVYSGGNICMGSAKAKKSNDVIKIMKNYEKAFFGSKFTHLHSQGSPIDGNLNTYFNKLIKSKCKFDKSLLKRSKVEYINDLI